MSQHTPGPWLAEDNKNRCRVYAPNKGTICETFGQRDAECEANARLIAEAPALASVLDDCVCELKACSAWQDALAGEDDRMLEVVNNAEELLAKTNGEAFTPHKVGDDQ